MTEIFAVVVNKDDTVRVVSRVVERTTAQFYYIPKPPNDALWDERYPFGYNARIEKQFAHTSARAALEHYMARRQRDKENAKAVIAQATKQIASANEALMHLPAVEPA